jgi:2-succinyl-5-enolpyruvyl-6-hydroxy-3-cyclohexene-1-carboxylate synthase
VVDAHCARPDWEGAVARCVVDAVPDGGALHLANSMPIREVSALCPPDGRHRITYVSRGVNGIDGTLSTAAGEAVGGGRPVTALVGDLAFLHDLGGLLVAARAPVTFVVVDNGGGGIFDFLPIAGHGRHFETRFRTPQTADIGQLCAGAGVRYRAVKIGPALTAAVAEEHARAGASVIHVTVDPAVNVARHQALWAEVAEAAGVVL